MGRKGPLPGPVVEPGELIVYFLLGLRAKAGLFFLFESLMRITHFVFLVNDIARLVDSSDEWASDEPVNTGCD